uniref:CLAVATA3/ESR (CLE)-related protein 25 n=1 Tax=Tanacetum cinerariifolium TaxID=118510 RepID=A0A6L2NCU8_TANCI|nr:CLAVATA3/ESR (CLE)-related protein 25 [Tanacetum cinerariifolium]
MERNGRLVLRTVFLVGFCWFLLFGVSTSFGVFKSREVTRKEGSVLNYVSKRRVPNGPDPIHNRRTRNTGQPPNRA